MAVKFNNILFDVMMSDDATLPLPSPDEAGFDWYDATIRCDRADYVSLYALVSGIDIIPAMAMRGGGLITRRWGVGSKTLVYPLREGTERTQSAILVSLIPTAEFLQAKVLADARWLIIGGV